MKVYLKITMSIPIFVINLEKDKGRLDFMVSQFWKFHMSFERFPAVTPDILSKEQLDSVDFSGIKEKYHTNFRPGEIACAYSHKSIMERIVNENISCALVLEDDVVLDEKFFSFVSSLEKKLERWESLGWEYLQCNYHIMDSVNFWRFYHETIRRMRWWFMDRILLLLKIFAWAWLMWVEYILMLMGKWVWPISILPIRPYSMAGTYFLTHSGAKKILETMQGKILAPADIIQNIARNENNLRLRLLVPQLSVQDGAFESNTLH